MAALRRFALIPAAGKSERFGAAMPKQYASLAGAPVLRRTIEALNRSVALDATFVVLAQDDRHYAERVGPIAGVVPIYCGGQSRAESVSNGLARIAGQAGPDDWVLVHDAARPCVDAAMLDRLLHELEDEPVGGLLAVPLADTLKRAEIGERARVAATEARTGLWCAQTPQMFRFGVLQRAMARADAAKVTDEAQAIEALGMKPRLVLGSPANIKLTYVEDLALAEAILAREKADAGATMPWRVGSGFDVHRLVAGRPLVLGGVTLAYERGLEGHSDADVLLHAICDAILGAIAEGDIGRHFPDTDPAYKDAESRALLRAVWERASAAGYALGNVDATVVAEAPRLAPHTAQMAANIATDCRARPGQVNVKATTSEGLGFTGRGEGIAAWATVLLFKPQ